MAEITKKGFKLKTQNEWFKDEKRLYLNIDPQWNLDYSTPDGLKLASDAEIFGNLDELAQIAYNSKDPNRATFYDLDAICAISGVRRSNGTPSTVDLTLKGVTGTVIISLTKFKSPSTGSEWQTDNDVTINANGEITVRATCTKSGTIQANANTITQIVDVVGGLQSVNNKLSAVSGTNVESDSQLRIKRNRSVSKQGDNQVDSLTGALFDTLNVRHVKILENDTDVVQATTNLPKNSIAVIVDGGVDDDVALTIFRKKNPGCKLHDAATSVKVDGVYDKYPSNAKDIIFSRPVYANMVVKLTIKNDGSLSNDVGDEIKLAVLEYAQGDLLSSTCGFNSTGFDIGEDIPLSRLYTPINHIIGKYGNSYIESLNVNDVTTGKIIIAFNAISKWTAANITVVVNE